MRLFERCLTPLLVVAVAGVLASPAQGAPTLPLGHAGRWITDARGRVVILHGPNMVYKVAPYFPAAVGFDDDDAAFLARLGFNAVRVGVIWKAVEPTPGHYDDAYLSHIAATVRTLKRHGIVSLLDFHQDMYNETFQGEGFPDWSVQDDGLPHQPKRGFPDNYYVMSALQHAYDHFWENSAGPGEVGLQDRYAAAWRHVARRFRGTRGVLGYELMNEPFPGTQWQSCAALTGCPVFDATLTAFNKRIDAAIRQVDRHTLVWYEPNVAFDFGPDTDVGALGDRRAGFSFHDYCFQYDASGSTTSCAKTGDQVVANAIKHVRKTGEALLMTEFGDPKYSLISAMVRRDDRNMVSWLEWSYCPCHDPTGAATKNRFINNPARPPAGSNLNLAALRILAEPYPQVIAGKPRSWGFNPATKTFQLRFSTARTSGHGRFPAGSPTEISTPPFVYDRHYGVHVIGGAIASAPGASVLRIASCPGARRVTVIVRPSGKRQGSCQLAAPAARSPGSR